MLEGMIAAAGGSFALKWTPGYAIGVNHPEATHIARDTVVGTLGDEALKILPHPMFGCEGFSPISKWCRAILSGSVAVIRQKG